MATQNKYTINGLIDTSKNVLQNLNDLARSAGCFITWDNTEGKWSVIVNQVDTSVKSFNDSNILGSININGTGIADMYNSVQIEFPHKDLRDATDYVVLDIASADRYEGELDNQFQIALPTINDPIQAQLIANQELKQSRVDKIVQFRSDFTANGLKAGDLIDITASMYGYTNKVFRIIQLEEEDNDDGSIIFSITALEYDANVYSTTGLTRETRTVKNGIRAKITNEEIAQMEDIDIGKQIGRLLAANVANGIINSLFSVDDLTGAIINEGKFADEDTQKLMESAGKKPSLTHTTDTTVCSGTETNLNLAMPASCTSNCFFEAPAYDYDYEITGVTAGEVSIALTGTVSTSDGTGVITFTPNVNTEKTLTITVGDNTSNITVAPAPDWTINATPTSTSITEGDSVTVNLAITGIANGETIPYTISGISGSRLSTPASGNVTVSGGSASLPISTTDDSSYTGTQTMSVSFSGPSADYCGTGGTTSVDITVLDNDLPTNTCLYVQVPLVWCGIYNGTDDELSGVSVRKYAYLPVAQAGESTVSVPTSLSVTKGNPSTIAINSTTDVASSASLGGIPFNVLTSFNTVAPLGLITGTATTIYGYDSF